MRRRQHHIGHPVLASFIASWFTACTSIPEIQSVADAAMRSDTTVQVDGAAAIGGEDTKSPKSSKPPITTNDASVGTANTPSRPARPAEADAAAAAAGNPADAGQNQMHAPAYGESCSQPGAQACTAMYPNALLRCDEGRWTIKGCGSEIEGYCEPVSGLEGAACFFGAVERCAGRDVGARVCVGREVHACDGDRTRMVTMCEGDKPLCREGECGCVNDICPERLATTTGIAAQLALSGPYLYWRDPVARVIARVPIAGGRSAVVVTRSNDITSLVADANNLFWTESAPGSVMKAAPDGSGATAIASNLQPRALTLDAAAVYWISDGVVENVAKSGGTPMQLAPAAAVDTMTVAGGYIYLGAYEQLSRVPVAGGEPMSLITMASITLSTPKLAASATHLYFRATLPGADHISLVRVPLAGGMVSLVENSPGSTFELDARHVYFSHSARLLRRNLDGTGLVVVWDSQSNTELRDIELDSEWIYFSVEETIYRLHKLSD